jgi:hypothetical protein
MDRCISNAVPLSRNKECVLYLRGKHPATKDLFSEVDVDRRLSSNHSTTPIPYTEVILLTSGGGRAALRRFQLEQAAPKLLNRVYSALFFS